MFSSNYKWLTVCRSTLRQYSPVYNCRLLCTQNTDNTTIKKKCMFSIKVFVYEYISNFFFLSYFSWKSNKTYRKSEKSSFDNYKWIWIFSCENSHKEYWRIGWVGEYLRRRTNIFAIIVEFWTEWFWNFSVTHSIELKKGITEAPIPQLNDRDLVYITGEIQYQRYPNGKSFVSIPKILGKRVLRMETESDADDLEQLEKGNQLCFCYFRKICLEIGFYQSNG